MARREPLGRRYWTVWAAASVSFAGDGIAEGAMPLLAASLTRDPRLVSLVNALTMLGWVLLGLVSGVVVDRVDKLGLMGRVDLARGLVMGGFAALVLTGHASILLVYAASLALGLVAPFFDNAAASVVPELVGSGQLERANALTQASLAVGANLVGPPVGALLFVLAAGVPLALDALSFAVAAVVVLLLARRSPRRERPTHGGTGWAQLAEGVRYLAGDRLLRTLALAVGAVNAVVGGVVAVLVLFVLEVLALPDAAYGWVVAAFAVGGVLGALTTAALVRRVGQRAAVLGSLVAFALSALALGLTSSVPAVVLILVVAGLAGTVWNVVTMSYRQRVVPAPLPGRVTSGYRLTAFVAIPVGAAGAGLMSHIIGIPHTYLVGGIMLLVVSALVAPALGDLPGRAPVGA